MSTEELIMRLEAVREELRMGRNEFSMKLTSGPSLFYALKSGKSKGISYQSQERLAAMGVNLNWLMTGEGEMLSVPVERSAPESPKTGDIRSQVEYLRALLDIPTRTELARRLGVTAQRLDYYLRMEGPAPKKLRELFTRAGVGMEWWDDPSKPAFTIPSTEDDRAEAQRIFDGLSDEKRKQAIEFMRFLNGK